MNRTKYVCGMNTVKSLPMFMTPRQSCVRGSPTRMKQDPSGPEADEKLQHRAHHQILARMQGHSDSCAKAVPARRRARDRLLDGETPQIERSEIDNLLLFAAEDVRASAAAVAGIEQFLVAVHERLSASLSADQIDDLLAADVHDKIGELDAAMGSLLRSMGRLRGVLVITPGTKQ